MKLALPWWAGLQPANPSEAWTPLRGAGCFRALTLSEGVEDPSTTAHQCGGVTWSSEPATQFFKPQTSCSVPQTVSFGTEIGSQSFHFIERDSPRCGGSLVLPGPARNFTFLLHFAFQFKTCLRRKCGTRLVARSSTRYI